MMQALSGERVDAYENRIPIHYIKGHTFWVGQEGCGYAQKRDEGKIVVTNIPLYRIPNWGLYQSDVAFGEGVSWRDFPRTDGDATGVLVGRFCFAASRSLSPALWRKDQRLINRA